MLKNYLKIAFRKIRQEKLFSFINIIGLALGLTCIFLALLWDSYHISYDRHNEKYDQIYRDGFHQIVLGIVYCKLLLDYPQYKNA